MKKELKFKNWVSYTLYSINVMLVLLNVMLLAEFNECWLFYSLSANIVILNTYSIHKFSGKKFNDKYMYIY